MKKQFVECKVEIVDHKGKRAVKLNGSTPKLLHNFNTNGDIDKLKDIFVTHKRGTSIFEVCQLTVDAEGYNKIYIIEANNLDEADIKTAKIYSDIDIWGEKQFARSVAMFVYKYIMNTIKFEKVTD